MLIKFKKYLPSIDHEFYAEDAMLCRVYHGGTGELGYHFINNGLISAVHQITFDVTVTFFDADETPTQQTFTKEQIENGEVEILILVSDDENEFVIDHNF